MSRSRLWRSHSTDDFLNRTLNSYPSVAGDNSYLPSSFDYSDSLDYDQGFQSRDDRRSSQYSGYDERPTSRCQSHPMKERRVTWAPFPESSPNRDRLLSTLERRVRDSAYGNGNESYPIHGYEDRRNSTHRSTSRYNSDNSSYNSWPTKSSLYDIRPSTRDPSSSYNSSLYGTTEPRSARDYLRSAVGPRMTTHRYPSFSSLKNPFSNIGYIYPTTESGYRGSVNSLLTAYPNSRRPKMRRSVIGLNRWSMHY
ncbi:hypothetical protein Pst134EA_024487 [Puccinia striiformis f. sp. tritici]|uniref:hypothetical protein n=1 Tax=Puccinia striiformis f. sp. tritici TaxID=168172 RepID=UPI0020083E80|nr:hypothetical protein Pst134EA_024487 [Puccinia striiformis f. sp. tritici]KAH9453619.1 hypothetical protein Pst134EA_024487 [Puccinia striiformis f. sp. tritici]